MNQTQLIGRLTRDPEHRQTPNGISTCTFSIAVTRQFNRDEADFLNIVTWRGLADNCGNYLKKGSQVGVAGRIQSRSYEGSDGKKHYVTEIVADTVEFLSPKFKDTHEAEEASREEQHYKGDFIPVSEEDLDGLPF